MSAADSLAAIVLAAGGARRYGSPKALAPLRGQPMLQHVLDVLDGQCDVTLVLGADAASIGAALRLPRRVVVNDRWAEGLASSIKAGLDAIGDNSFLETPASGAANRGLPGSVGFGTVQQGFLETSNVNAVTEISALITAQRAYEMNCTIYKK